MWKAWNYMLILHLSHVNHNSNNNFDVNLCLKLQLLLFFILILGNHVLWMIGFTEFRAGIRTNQVNKLITLFLIPNRFSWNKAHIPPNYSKQTFISKSLHNMQSFATQVRTIIVFSISTLLGLLRKITIHCRKTLRWMVAWNNEKVCAFYCIIIE